jgi:glycosyltransferase involved in cell wall biosynthesis
MALGQLLDAPDRRAELASAGRKRVEGLFDIRAIARQMDEFIEACVGQGRGEAQMSDPGRHAALPL